MIFHAQVNFLQHSKCSMEKMKKIANYSDGYVEEVDEKLGRFITQICITSRTMFCW